jgi:hypothetical protein
MAGTNNQSTSKNKSRGLSGYQTTPIFYFLGKERPRKTQGGVDEQIWCDVRRGGLFNQGQYRYRAPVQNEHWADDNPGIVHRAGFCEKT